MAHNDIRSLDNPKKICWACLNTDNRVRNMNNKEANLYNNLIGEIQSAATSLYLCSFCAFLMRKFEKFIQQCQRANCYLKLLLAETTSPQCISTLTDVHNLIIEKPSVFCIGLKIPEEPLKSELENVKEEYAECEYDDNIGSDTLICEAIVDSDADDVPLAFIKNGECSKRTNRRPKRKKKRLKNDECVSTKSKKELREGFSSRMVQETEEYIVIKLTKEQVVQEMMEKSKSAKYLCYNYKCEKCVLGFNFQDVLEKHMEKHSLKNGTLECEICTQRCPSGISLRGHMKSHTTRYKCKVCGVVRRNRQHLLEHHAVHTSAVTCYKCENCTFTTCKRTVMQRHVRRHSSEEYTCSECGVSLKSLDSLRVHTARAHTSKLLRCEQCSKSFIYPSQLRKHVASVHDRREYYCVECDVSFNSRENMMLHFKRARRHRDPSMFKHVCPLCFQRFYAESSLEVHLTTSHGAAKRYSCQRCEHAYSTKESLRGHVRRIHERKKNISYGCSWCSKVFSRKDSLKNHIRTHSDMIKSDPPEQREQKEHIINIGSVQEAVS